jgi:hypothetical protein
MCPTPPGVSLHMLNARLPLATEAPDCMSLPTQTRSSLIIAAGQHQLQSHAKARVVQAPLGSHERTRMLTTTNAAA